jgi:hypothetical protein
MWIATPSGTQLIDFYLVVARRVDLKEFIFPVGVTCRPKVTLYIS